MTSAAQQINKNDLVFDPSPTQDAFVNSDANIVMLVGPMGEGKTYAGVFGMIRHAARCGKNIRGALIRDTLQNIKISTAPDIQEILGPFVEFKDDFKKMIIHSSPKVEVDCFGIDDPGALSKLQGPQYAVIWLEEPAPIANKANAGLPRGVFNMSIARAARQTGTLLRVQVTQNPADEDHWTEEVFHKPRVYASDPVTGLEIIKECFRIPARENTRLNPLARAANIAAFQDDPGLLSRYVDGIAAAVRLGKPVIKNYNPTVHFSQDVELPVHPNLTGVRFWDAYHHPSCIIGQIVPPNRLILHDVLYEEGIGVKELISQQVQPLLGTSKYKDKILHWRDIGDPSMSTPDQSTVNQSAAKTVERMLGARFEQGPVRWPQRIDPAITAFSTLASDGNPLVVLSKTAYFLHRGLNGGWYWKTDNNGYITGSEPVKNKYSHPGDALLYGLAILYPDQKQDHYKKLIEMSQKDRMARAMSYGPSAAASRSVY